MTILNRTDAKARKVGNSMTLSLPWRLVKEWKIAAGDRLVTYQLDRVLVVLPLSHLLEIGEPTLLRQLTEQAPVSYP